MNEFSEVANLDQSLSVEVARPSSYSFLNDLSISEDVKRRLSLHLDRVVSGSNEVFLSPIGKNNDPERLSELLLAMLNKSTVINSVLMQMEISNLDKFGPRSIAKPWVDRRDSVLNYYSNRSGPSFELDYRKLNLRPISVINGIKLLKNNTNSGLPYYTRKSRVKDRVSRDFSSLIESDYPCILFTRTQEGNKTRNVWGYPIATTLNESLFYSPLLNYQRKLIWRSALIGPSAVDREVMRMVSQSVVTDKVLLSIDFSAYDASVSMSL